MFHGFDFKISIGDAKGLIHKFHDSGLALYEAQQGEIKRGLDAFLAPDGSINASQMEAEWFPKFEADVFLSHSHKDEKLAISLAGLFFDIFNIRTFVDSCVWGYSAKLLKKIDKKFCTLNEETETYSYEQRNLSTAHVHMMLASALSKTIDQCECMMFLNTPGSVKPEQVIQQTASPWIYYEIGVSKMIRRRRRRRMILKAEDSMYKRAAENLEFSYDLDKAHLTAMDSDDLEEWLKGWIEAVKTRSRLHALDLLYGLKKVV
jgi:hypothetical protein